MKIKLALITLFIVLLYEECEGKENSRHPPKEKESSLFKPKQEMRRNRFYRSVMPSRPTDEGEPEEVSGTSEEIPAKDIQEKGPGGRTRLTQLFLELEEMKELAELELKRILQKSIAKEVDLFEQLIKKKYELVHETLDNESASSQNIADDYKLEGGLDNNLSPFEAQKVILGDPNLVLQRKRWKRAANPMASQILLSGGLGRVDSLVKDDDTANHDV